jgi:hypothetical protein
MPRSSRLRAGAATAGAMLLTMAATGVVAQEPSRSVSDAILAPVIVTAPPPVAASSELLIPGEDFELLPHGRPADVLRLLPGLILSQHQVEASPSSICCEASTPATAPTSRSS